MLTKNTSLSYISDQNYTCIFRAFSADVTKIRAHQVSGILIPKQRSKTCVRCTVYV